MKKIKPHRPPPLWLRLLIYFLILAAAVLLTVQFLFNYSLERHFEAYIREREAALNRQIVLSLQDYYAQNGSWFGVHMVMRHAAISTGTRLVLEDPGGRLLFDTAAPMGRHGMMSPRGVPPLDETSARGFTLEREGRAVGRLYIVHPDAAEPGALREQDLVFRRALQSSLLWAGAAGVGAALLLSILFSRRFSRPLEEMARAVRRITKGDYTRRLSGQHSRELDELSRDFNRMLSHLQELENLRRRSAADISHELRTPLATLRSHLEAVKDGVMEADSETVAVLLEEIAHLSRIAASLEELALAESRRRGQGERERIDLNRFLSDRAASFKPLFREKAVSLNLELPEKMVIVKQDPVDLGKIIGNLLANAWRYTGPGGSVTLRLTENPPPPPPGAVLPLGAPPPVITGDRLPPAGTALIEVSDTGCGIAPEHLPYIFERFFRADAARERLRDKNGLTAGTGIGLALVKELVRAAGGAILVTSRPGQGTTFYLYLPPS